MNDDDAVLTELKSISDIHEKVQTQLRVLDQNLLNLKSIACWLHRARVIWTLITYPSWSLQLELVGMNELSDWQLVIMLHPSTGSFASLYYAPILPKLSITLGNSQELPSILEIYLLNSKQVAGKNYPTYS
jgi:hypothetical protein